MPTYVCYNDYKTITYVATALLHYHYIHIQVKIIIMGTTTNLTQNNVTICIIENHNYVLFYH